MKLLQQLYRIRSYSKKEDEMISFLKKHHLPEDTKEHGRNLYRLKDPTQPIVCAHMDQINCSSFPVIKSAKEFEEHLKIYKRMNDTVSRFEVSDDNIIKAYNGAGKQVSLGADDKNGIWIILNLLKDYPDLNFILTVEEECGLCGSTALSEHDEVVDFLEEAPFMLVLDRKGGTDIINEGYGGWYSCSLHHHIKDLSEELNFNYEFAKGSSSDANNFSKIIECVNLSVGYYKAHTANEYTDMDELDTAYTLVFSILMNPFEGKFRRMHQDAYENLMEIKGYRKKYQVTKTKEKEKTADTVEHKVVTSLAGSTTKTQQDSAYDAYDTGLDTIFETKLCPSCYQADTMRFELEDNTFIVCPFCEEILEWDDDLAYWDLIPIDEQLCYYTKEKQIKYSRVIFEAGVLLDQFKLNKQA